MPAEEPDVDPASVPEATGAPIRRHRRRDRNRLDGVGDQPSPSRQPLRGFAELVDVVRTDDIALAPIAESRPDRVRVLEGLGQLPQGLLASQYGRMRLVLVRRIFRGLNNARLLRATQGQSRIRPWRTSHA